MDDDIIDDADFSAIAAASSSAKLGPQSTSTTTTGTNGDGPRKVQQPKPQALASKGSTSVILVSPRQKGNPVLNNIRGQTWEYSDIPADFVLGTTTCALFLSLKYHRLHPEYVYSRIKGLGGKYGLRILLTMVDIQNHEEPLKELSKTSLINNVTIILAWTAQEAGHYLDLYKQLEHTAPTKIKAVQSTTYSDQLVDFVTVPGRINKTDAVGLVSNFGSIRTAINARPEEITLIAGWGEKKVQAWCQVVREPFRVQRTARRGLAHEDSRITPSLSRGVTQDNETPVLSRDTTQPEGVQDARVAARLGIGAPLPVDPVAVTNAGVSDADKRSNTRIADEWEPGLDEEEAMAEAVAMTSVPQARSKQAQIETQRDLPDKESPQTKKRRFADEELADGVAAALAKFRK